MVIIFTVNICLSVFSCSKFSSFCFALEQTAKRKNVSWWNMSWRIQNTLVFHSLLEIYLLIFIFFVSLRWSIYIFSSVHICNIFNIHVQFPANSLGNKDKATVIVGLVPWKLWFYLYFTMCKTLCVCCSGLVPGYTGSLGENNASFKSVIHAKQSPDPSTPHTCQLFPPTTVQL